jgi:thiamine biosynthesis lipoprotein
LDSETNTHAKSDLHVWQKAGHYQGLFRAMGSPCELLVETDNKDLALKLLRTVANEAWRVEAKFSRYLPDNIIAQINQSAGQPVTVDDETANLLDFGETLYQLSDKRFDITSGVLRKVWTFDGTDQIPLAREIIAVVNNIGWHQVSWHRPAICLRADMQIDLGGIGKEYAVDRAAGLLAKETSCACLVNFGGDLAIVGKSLSTKGWQVGIEAPGSENGKAQKLILLKTGALATSGDSRRYLLKNGKRYSHILNPLTGWPIEDAPRSITVAADTCTQAGMLATLAMLCGAEAEVFLESQDTQYWCLR